MKKHIMLDLETMGNGNNAAIVAIGACEFDINNDIAPGHTFSALVDLASCVEAGLVVDASTVMWWMKQSDAARRALEGDRMPLGDALHRFTGWVDSVSGCKPDDVIVWGNGATFGNVIIRSAFKAVRLPVPWSFRGDRCYRTVSGLLPEDRQPAFARFGTAHSAVDDAITQAVHLQKVWKALSLSGSTNEGEKQ